MNSASLKIVWRRIKGTPSLENMYVCIRSDLGRITQKSKSGKKLSTVPLWALATVHGPGATWRRSVCLFSGSLVVL